MMGDKTNQIMDIFRNGSIWLKADFHLHTRSDKEFTYEGDENRFIRDYIDRLKQSRIAIGIIANHNKFNLDEFKTLRKNSLKENIFLIPGIELSVDDGSNGIHALVAFEYESWVKNNDNFVEQFINSAFEGISNRENSNTRCRYNIADLCEKLEEHRKKGRDTFVVMAHVEQDNGFCKELEGGRIQSIIQNDHFRKNVLAFQKLRTRDLKNKLLIWLGEDERKLPAFVEGSDCKNIEQIGLCGTQKNENGDTAEKACFVKIGDFNFEAVKYALTDKENRVSNDEHPKVVNAYIKSISFEGGLLNGSEINFSPELNNFIGIRGSGKSSVIEILRYTIGISLGNQASDRDYKNSLIEHVLGSGGEVIVNVVNEHKKEYKIKKIYGQKENIYDEKGLRMDAPSVYTVFKTPVYFGQKDLSNKHINFEADLVKEKLIGNKLDVIKSKIELKTTETGDAITSSKKLDNLDELKKEIACLIRDAEIKLNIYKEKGVEEKLRRQSRYDSDLSRFNETVKEVTKFKSEIDSVINNFLPFFSQTTFNSEDNKDLFGEAEKIFQRLSLEFNKLRDIKTETETHEASLKELSQQLLEKKDSLKEEFAKIKREIAIPNLNPDDFLKFNRQIETSRLKLAEIEKSEKKKNEYNATLNNNISELNHLWLEEYRILEKEVARINEYERSLSISVEYKGRKDIFGEKIRKVFAGTGLRGATYDQITGIYKDFIEIFRDMENLNSKLNISENLLAEFKKRFHENLFELLTFRIEDKFTIKYHGKPLKDHSLGQRATALILFLLAQKETNVLIIDQPEDDLDNQTIYEDVIKEIKTLKGKMQFIFATHNANIPVLGDSEKIMSCSYSESKIDLSAGTIDNHDMQKQIVTIMEGGEEAFSRRKNIYELWSLRP